jgi:hypothetical protein
MMAGPHGMVHWGLDEGHTKMDSRGVDALFGIVAASIVDLARAMRISVLEFAQQSKEGDNF